MQKRILPIFIAILALGIAAYLWLTANTPKPPQPIPATQTAIPTVAAHAPQTLSLAESPLKKNILAAGDYLVRQQLSNGELPYQVNILTNDRSSTPSYIRLMGGVSALYTVCRVSEDSSYCESADRALTHYLPNLLADPERFNGTCLYTNGACPLGGAAVTIDAVYKRWQAGGGVTLGDRNLLTDAVDLGYFIVSMRRPDGGFYHSFDPHFMGAVDADYFDPTFNGEAAAALLQLYEMTGNEFWLDQAREVNSFMLSQPVTEDHSHAYALSLLARLDKLNDEDHAYAKQIADLIIAGQIRSLNPANSSIVTATKIEALSALAQSFAMLDAEHEWLEREINAFITFAQARQLPANDCNFDLTSDMKKRSTGGLFNTCEDPSIRVDGIQHWVNGLTMYLEYLGMAGSR